MSPPSRSVAKRLETGALMSKPITPPTTASPKSVATGANVSTQLVFSPSLSQANLTLAWYKVLASSPEMRHCPTPRWLTAPQVEFEKDLQVATPFCLASTAARAPRQHKLYSPKSKLA